MPQAQPSTKQNVVEPLEPKAAMVEMVQVVENKKRNLEKRKQKLELLEAKPVDQLTEQQKEAITHIGEVNGNIQYVEEILVRFREIQAQVDKWVSIEAKKEKLASQRSKKSAKKNGESAPTQNESAANDVHNEVSAEATPPSRGSVCEAAPAVGDSQKDSTAQNVPANATDSTENTSNQISAPAVEPAAPAVENSHEQPQNHEHVQDAEVPQRDDGAQAEEDGVTPKETITFVNSQAEANANAHAEDERAFSAPSGRYHQGGPRRDHGPRGGYGYGQQYGRPPRRGGRGPYRGQRGPPRGGPAPNAGSNVPPASAGSRAGEFRGG